MHTLQYTVGDWSNDGHGQRDVYFLLSTHDEVELKKAFELGVNNIGHDIRQYFAEYEENSIPVDAAVAFMKYGVELDEPFEDLVWCGPDDVMNIIIATIKAGNIGISLEIIKPIDLCHTIGSVGYGCYM